MAPQEANQLAVVDQSFCLPALVDLKENLETVRLNLEGTGFEFDRIKIPSGGGLAFELPGENGPEISQFLTGIILDHYQVNAYWKEAFSGEHNPPDCSSLDALTGVGNPGGNCITCPFNQYGSGVDPNGNPTKGKACKNIHRVYILQEGEIFPVLLALPPTSLKPFRDYMKAISRRNPVPFFGCVTKIGLQKAQSSTGITYSQATFTKVQVLSKEERAVMFEYARALKPQMRAVKIEAAEYNIDNDAGENGPETFAPMQPF